MKFKYKRYEVFYDVIATMIDEFGNKTKQENHYDNKTFKSFSAAKNYAKRTQKYYVSPHISFIVYDRHIDHGPNWEETINVKK